MRCQHMDDDIQCRFDATRRVLIGGGDPPDPEQSGFAGTVYLVQVCKEHDPDPRKSMPLPRPPGSVPSANVRGGRPYPPRTRAASSMDCLRIAR
jgi:hypothetical protein